MVSLNVSLRPNPAKTRGRLAYSVKNEVAVMSNADALVRLARKQRNRCRGTRER